MGQDMYLILENGKVFKGKGFGATGDVTGEVVFTTGMTGYLETLTDKSYYGQIVVQTFPLIGNYGIISEDFESDSLYLKAYIVKQWCQEPSNFRSEGDLDTFLKEKNVVGLHGIDTRALTKIIREVGVMNGRITSNIDNISLTDIKSHKTKDAVKNVSTKTIEKIKGDNSKFKVVFWDFGGKESIKRELIKRGCELICVPQDTTAEEIMNFSPDGIMLSNGPADPTENPGVIAELAKLTKQNIPMFGICLGHQLLALANGAKTQKLKYGHRGANQPARELATGKVYITSQNHGYAVLSDSLPQNKAEISFINANDNTCEGINYKTTPAFSVQFHPEASAGPQDTAFLFDKFIDLMGGKC